MNGSFNAVVGSVGANSFLPTQFANAGIKNASIQDEARQGTSIKAHGLNIVE